MYNANIDDVRLIIDAIDFATKAHGSQTRKSRKAKHLPYIVHPIEVMQILLSNAVDSPTKESMDMIVASVLHDVLEDTDKTELEIKSLFGDAVLSIVKELTDNPSLSKEEQRKSQIEHMFTASRSARLIKIADKTSNLRDLVRCPPGWKLSSVEKYTEHAQSVVLAASAKQDIPFALIREFMLAKGDVLNLLAEEKYAEKVRLGLDGLQKCTENQTNQS